MIIFKIKHIIFVIIFIVAMIFVMHIPDVDLISTAAKSSVRLPIIMYHHVLKDKNKLGKYIVSPKEVEEDIIYLKKQGYTTIVMQDLIDFVYNDKKLPDKPIMLTFDDGHYSNYTYVYPILKKYDCKAVMSIVGEYIDKSTAEGELNAAYSYFNWDILTELVNSPYIEIQNHTYGMHEICERRGCTIMKGESYDDYSLKIISDVGKLQLLILEKTGYKPTTFTYPYGFVCKECDEVLKDMGFLASLSCFEGVNILTGDEEELFELKRFNRASEADRIEFFKRFDK